jgi:Holliday junction DNA helicase RuvB
MLADNRITAPTEFQDEKSEVILRPQKLSDFIGQGALKQNLKVFIEAAKQRGESLDHVIFYGPPGLGKTTLSQIVAKELQVGFKSTSGPMLSKPGDLAAILTNLKTNEILFIDEIHRLTSSVEEVLYSAMEDFTIDLVIGEGPAARAVKINLPRFTLIGATTRLGLLTNPLRDRFGIPLKLDFYSHNELQSVIIRGAELLNIAIAVDAANELAKCARGTPRIAIRLLKRIRDFASYQQTESITRELVNTSLRALGVDKVGLDGFDYKYLKYIAENYNGGPVGIETIAAGLSEDRETIEDTIEPYLMQLGFISRTPRGRVLSQNALQHMNFSFT